MQALPYPRHHFALEMITFSLKQCVEEHVKEPVRSLHIETALWYSTQANEVSAYPRGGGPWRVQLCHCINTIGCFPFLAGISFVMRNWLPLDGKSRPAGRMAWEKLWTGTLSMIWITTGKLQTFELLCSRIQQMQQALLKPLRLPTSIVYKAFTVFQLISRCRAEKLTAPYSWSASDAVWVLAFSSLLQKILF